jgi:hypothetical protein
MNKRAAIKWLDNWAEIAAFSVMIVGIIIALLSDSALISYIIIALAGFMVGRAYYMRKSRMRFPFYLITVFFLAGYIIGTAITDRGEPIPIIIFFIIGMYFGNYLYKRRMLR